MPQRSPAALYQSGPPRRIGGPSPALLLGAVVLGVLALLFAPNMSSHAHAQQPTPTPTPSTTTRISPTTQNVSAGTDLIVEVRADNVSNLGAYEFRIDYFDSTLHLVSVTNGPFLGSTGRSIFCLNAIVDVGSFRYGCVSLGAGNGPSGSDALLATLRFSTSCDGQSPLHLGLVGLSNTLGGDIPTSMQDGSATVTGGGSCPTPTPTFTPTETPTLGPETATPTHTPSPTVGPTSTPSPLQCGGPAASVFVCVLPAAQFVSASDPVTLQIGVDNVTNLGGFQLSLSLNDQLLMPVTMSAGPFLGSTGRSLFCLPSGGSATLQLTCSTLGSAVSGPDGNGILAEVHLQAVDLVAGTSPIQISAVLADVLGHQIAINGIRDGTVTVLGPPTPSVTPTLTLTPTITNTPPPTPTSTPCPTTGCPPTSTPTDTLTPTNTGTPTNTRTPTSSPTITQTPGPGPCGATTLLTLCVQPVTQSFFRGGDTTIDVAGANLTDLGAFQFTLAFNPAVISAINFQVGPFLGSTGRSVTCFQPSAPAGIHVYVCNTLGNAPPGPTGSGVLGTITLHGVGAGISSLGLQDILLSRVSGLALPAPAVGAGAITVIEPPTPTITLTPTITQTPTITLTPTNTLTPTPCPTGGCPTPTITNTPTITPTRTSTPTRTPTPGPLTLRISPVAQSVSPLDLVPVDIYVDGATNLGAYQFTITFNPAVLGYSSNVAGPFLSSTSRSTFCLAPATGLGSVTISCNSLANDPPGPNGTGNLHTVNFLSQAAGVSGVHLTNILLSTIAAVRLQPVVSQDGTVTVGVPPTATLTPTPTPTASITPTPTASETPTVTPTPTASITPTPTASETPTITPTPLSTATPAAGGTTLGVCADMDGNGVVAVADILYAVHAFMTSNPLADLNHSGLVTIADILAVVHQFARRCSR